MGELGATREAARQQREEKEEAKSKKEKDGAGREGAGTAVGGVADSGVPTIVVINAGDDEKETGGGLDAEQVRPEIVEKEDRTEQPGADAAEAAEAGSAAAAATAAVEAAGDIESEEDTDGDSAVLQDLGAQVLKECGATCGSESAEGLAEFVGSLASGAAEGAFSALEHFGPVGPLFKCLGMFMHFVGRVKGARTEGQRLKLWGRSHTHTHTHTCIHACMHTCIQACIHTYIHTRG